MPRAAVAEAAAPARLDAARDPAAPRQQQQQQHLQQRQHQRAASPPPPSLAQGTTDSGAGGDGFGIGGSPEYPWTARRGRWADDDPPCDQQEEGDGSQYAADDLAADDGDDGPNAWDDEVSEETLKQRWQQECRAVRALEDCGTSETCEALAAAKAARDRARQLWMDAKEPRPVAIRMGWAQKRLDKAQRSLERCRSALAQFEVETESRREALRKDIEEAEHRCQMRWEQMDALNAEAGEMASGGASGGGVRRGDDRRIDDLAKGLLAVIECLDEGSEARSRANLLLAQVACASEPVRGESWRCHIGSDDGEASNAMDTDCGRQCEDDSRQGHGEQARWSERAHGRWNKGQGDGTGATSNVTRSPGEVRGGHATSRASTQGATGGQNAARAGDADGGDGATRTGHGGQAQAAGARTETPAEGGAQGNTGGPPHGGRAVRAREESPCRASAAKQHRGHDIEQVVSVEAGGDDQARARKLMQEQALVVAATVGSNSTFGDEQSRQLAGQLYAHKVELVKARATAAGLDTMPGGRQLIELDPQSFNAWVAEHLEPAEARARDDEKDL